MNEAQKQQLHIQMLAASQELDRLIKKYQREANDFESIPFSDKMLDVQSKIRSLNVLLIKEKEKLFSDINPGISDIDDTGKADE